MVSWGKLIFGGVDSSEYGIYITGEGVYNAPERAVEFVDVPGRNGAIALDQGRYTNIEVTYPAGVFGKDPEEFREALSEFRNAILSQRGYQRLEDTYHPEEFREAIYVAGLEVEPSQKKAGQFELTFNCKPQRWLTVGDVGIPVSNGTPIINPTLFESSPLLEITGEGLVEINGYSFELTDESAGDTTLVPPFAVSGRDLISKKFVLDSNLFNDEDMMTVPSFTFRTVVRFDGVITAISGELSNESLAGVTMTGTTYKNNYCYVNLVFPEMTLPLAKNAVYENYYQALLTTRCTIGGMYKYFDINAYYILSKMNQDEDSPITLEFAMNFIPDSSAEGNIKSHQIGFQITEGITVDSTINILGNPTYIDCATGEAYKYVNDTMVNLNSKIPLGADLPVLVPGPNQVFKANSITRFNVVPRWWRI